MNILMLGGAGFIGKNLSLKLSSYGHDVTVFDRAEANFSDVASKCNIIKGDFSDTDIFKNFFSVNNIDIVFHLISSIVPGTDLNSVITEVDQNLISTMKFVDLMNQNNIKKIVYFSSGGTVYGNNGNHENCESDLLMPINSYGWMKVTVEKFLQYFSYQNGMQYIILRPSNPYGKFQNIFGKQGLIAVVFGKIIKNMPIEIWGDGSIVRDYIFIDDLCEMVSRIVERGNWNEIYNVGSGVGHSINEILHSVEKISGLKVDVRRLEARNIDVQVNILNSSKIKNQVGVDNLIGLEQGLFRTWEWIKTQYHYDFIDHIKG